MVNIDNLSELTQEGKETYKRLLNVDGGGSGGSFQYTDVGLYPEDEFFNGTMSRSARDLATYYDDYRRIVAFVAFNDHTLKLELSSATPSHNSALYTFDFIGIDEYQGHTVLFKFTTNSASDNDDTYSCYIYQLQPVSDK